MTKRMLSAYNRYRMTDKTSLYDAYGSFSQAKKDGKEMFMYITHGGDYSDEIPK